MHVLEMLCFAAVALKGSEEGCKYLHLAFFPEASPKKPVAEWKERLSPGWWYSASWQHILGTKVQVALWAVGKLGFPEALFAEDLVTVPLLLAAGASTTNTLARFLEGSISPPSSQASIIAKLLPAGLCFDWFKAHWTPKPLFIYLFILNKLKKRSLLCWVAVTRGLILATLPQATGQKLNYTKCHLVTWLWWKVWNGKFIFSSHKL